MAQTTKRTFSLGGNLGFTSTASDAFGVENKTNTISVVPGVAYFIADGMALGLSLEYGYSKTDNDQDGITTSNRGAVRPYFKYYHFTKNDKFAFTLEAAAQLGISRQNLPAESIFDDGRGTFFGFSISPGFTYFFTDNIGLDFQLKGIGFSRSVVNQGDSEFKSSYFTFGISSLDPSLGFRYYFSR